MRKIVFICIALTLLAAAYACKASPIAALPEAVGIAQVTAVTQEPEETAEDSCTYVTCSAALDELLKTAEPDTVLDIEIVGLDYAHDLETAFVHEGKTLPDYRNDPVLVAHTEAYDTWYRTEYPVVDEQNRDRPEWEKHDPGELFDAYWRERHSEAEILAYEKAHAAYIAAQNAYFDWRDSEAGREALRKIWQQECDRLNDCGFDLRVEHVIDMQYRMEGTAAVKLLRAFPANTEYGYFVQLQNDSSPIPD